MIFKIYSAILIVVSLVIQIIAIAPTPVSAAQSFSWRGYDNNPAKSGDNADCTVDNVPVLTAPPDGYPVNVDPVTLHNQPITLGWQSPCPSSSYEVQIALDNKFTRSVEVKLFINKHGIKQKTADNSTVIMIEEGGIYTLAVTIPEGALPEKDCARYWWRVRGSVSGNTEQKWSGWSKARSFFVPSTMAYQPGCALRLLSPENGSIGCVTSHLAFQWAGLRTYSGEYSTYQIEIAGDPGFKALVLSENSTCTSYEYNGTLKQNATYFWRVRGLEKGIVESPSCWSEPFSFYTGYGHPVDEEGGYDDGNSVYGSDCKPVLKYPSDNDIIDASYSMGCSNLSWESSCRATAYELQIAEDQDFTRRPKPETLTVSAGSVPLTAIWLPSESYIIDMGEPRTASPVVHLGMVSFVVNTGGAGTALPGGRSGMGQSPVPYFQYWWRVRSIYSDNNKQICSHWSEIRTFRILTYKPVGIAVLQSPGNGSEGISINEITFSWIPLEVVKGYRIDIAEDPEFSDIVLTYATATTCYEFNGKLDYETNYFWRVKEIDGNELDLPGDDWSATFAFKTQSSPSAETSKSNGLIPPLWFWIVIALSITPGLIAIYLYAQKMKRKG